MADQETPPSQSRNQWRRRFRIIVVCLSGAAALAITCWMLHHALHLTSDRVFRESFSFKPLDILGDADRFVRTGWRVLRPNTVPFPIVDEKDRGVWRGPGTALALAQGESGVLSYCLYRDPGETVRVDVQVRNDEDTSTRLMLQAGTKAPVSLPLSRDTVSTLALTGRTLDITPYLGNAHYFFFTIHSIRAEVSNESGGPRLGAALLPIVSQVEFTLQSEAAAATDRVSCVFFSLVCFLVWWLVLGYVVPQSAGILVILHHYVVRGGLCLVVGAVCCVAALWLVLDPQAERDIPPRNTGMRARTSLSFASIWSESKPHDDLWALGNARLLALRRFHTQDLFFRSRVRPGFLALALPLQTGLPHATASVSYTFSDGKERLFHVYDRLGWSWGTRIYPEASILGFLLALAGLALTGRLAFALDGGRGALARSVLAVALAAWFWKRALGTALVSPITLSATWTVQLAAMLAFAEATRVSRRWMAWAAAGVMAGIGVLFNESALAFLVPIALFQVYSWCSGEAPWERGPACPTCLTGQTCPTSPMNRRDLVRGVVLFWCLAAALPVFYYGLVLDGGFAEISKNFKQHLASQAILDGFERRGIAGTVRALWAVFGVGLVPAAAGMALSLRRRAGIARSAVFFAVWLLGCATVFTLPYFYPRFLVYMIPGMAWFAAEALRQLGMRAARVRKPPSPA